MPRGQCVKAASCSCSNLSSQRGRGLGEKHKCQKTKEPLKNSTLYSAVYPKEENFGRLALCNIV